MKRQLLALLVCIIAVLSAKQAEACHAIALVNFQAQLVPGGIQVTADSDDPTCGCGNYWLDVEVVCVNQPFPTTGFPVAWTGLNGPVQYNSAQMAKPNCVDQTYPWVTINFSDLCPGTVYKYRMREHHETGVPPEGPWSATFTFTTPGNPPNLTLTTAASNTNLCAPQSTNFSSTVNGGCAGVSYAWSPAAGLSCTNCPSPVATPSVSTTYSLTIVDSCSGQTVVSSIPIYVGNPPGPGVSTTANGTSSIAICSGTSTTLTVSGSSGNIQWQDSPDGIIFTNIPGATSASYTTPTLTDTMYYQAFINDPGCGSTQSNMITVNVNPNPVITASADASICMGNNTTLSASGASGFTWSPAAGLSSSTSSAPVASPTVTTTYTVTGTDGNGCSNTDAVTITVNTATLSTAGNASICNGVSTPISANASNAVSYSWSPATSLNSSNIPNPLASPSITTTYTVTSTDINGCMAQGQVTVNVLPLPAAFAGVDDSICIGSGTLLNASGGVSYAWSPATGLNTTTNSSPFATPTVTTTYTVTVTGSNGCVNTDTVTVFVNNPPVADAGNNVTICSGSNGTMLNATGGINYSWSPATGLSNTSVSNPVANPPASTTYTVTVTDAFGCVSTDIVQVNVSPAPLVVASPDMAICNGTGVNLTASGALSYTWSPATGLSTSNQPNPFATPNVTTTYTVTGTNANGCTSTDLVTITVSSGPNASNISVTDAICGSNDGQIVVGTTTGGNPPYSYSIGSQTSTNGVFTNLAPGFYNVTITDNTGCVSSQGVSVGQILGVNAAFVPSPASGLAPLNVTFTNNSTGATNYVWDFGVSGATSTLTNPTYTYTTPGVYTVTLSASNNDPSCQSVATFVIIVTQESTVLIPNVFSPNGDGSNEVFKITSTGLQSIDVSIYNRWGKKVAEWSGSPDSGWDGKGVEDGVYYYVLNATDLAGKTTAYNGFIQLLRQSKN
jgi:gliding motility-associated-like protein